MRHLLRVLPPARFGFRFFLRLQCLPRLGVGGHGSRCGYFGITQIGFQLGHLVAEPMDLDELFRGKQSLADHGPVNQRGTRFACWWDGIAAIKIDRPPVPFQSARLFFHLAAFKRCELPRIEVQRFGFPATRTGCRRRRNGRCRTRRPGRRRWVTG